MLKQIKSVTHFSTTEPKNYQNKKKKQLLKIAVCTKVHLNFVGLLVCIIPQTSDLNVTLMG